MLVGVVLAVGAYIGWYQWSGSSSRTVDAVPLPPPAIEQALREGSPPEMPPGPPAAAPNPSNANAAPAPVAPARSGITASGPAAPPAAAPAPPPAAPAAPAEGRILLRARAEVWIQVRERQGGPVLVNRVLRPGESWQVPARDGLLLSTGNAGGLEVLVDGQPTPGLGAGASVRRDLQVDAEKLKAGQPLASLAPRPSPASAPPQ
jgi:cytoskeleton protein RodZ